MAAASFNRLINLLFKEKCICAEHHKKLFEKKRKNAFLQCKYSLFRLLKHIQMHVFNFSSSRLRVVRGDQKLIKIKEKQQSYFL